MADQAERKVVGDEYLRAVEAPHQIAGQPVWHAQYRIGPVGRWSVVSVTAGPICFMTSQAALDAASFTRAKAVSG